MASTFDQTPEDDAAPAITVTVGDDETTSDAVLAAIQMASGRLTSPTQGSDRGDGDVVDPLFESVDPDALDALFCSLPGAPRSSGGVEFTHAGFEITVTAADEVTVRRVAVGTQ